MGKTLWKYLSAETLQQCSTPWHLLNICTRSKAPTEKEEEKLILIADSSKREKGLLSRWWEGFFHPLPPSLWQNKQAPPALNPAGVLDLRSLFLTPLWGMQLGFLGALLQRLALGGAAAGKQHWQGVPQGKPPAPGDMIRPQCPSGLLPGSPGLGSLQRWLWTPLLAAGCNSRPRETLAEERGAMGAPSALCPATRRAGTGREQLGYSCPMLPLVSGLHSLGGVGVP